MQRNLILAGALCLATLNGGARADDKPPFDLSDPQRIEIGKLRFNSSCAGYCHGFEGAGGNAPSFKGRGDDFDPDYAFRTITNGRKGSGDVMPRWGGAFTPEQIWELVAYLEFLAKQKT
jgi:mono/diheme cytochrome c family protein